MAGSPRRSSARAHEPLEEDPSRDSRAEEGPRRSLYPRVLAAAFLVLVVDQGTKTLALEYFGRRSHDLIEGVLSFDVSFNSGGVFGIGQGVPGLFLIATAVVIVAILIWVRNLEESSWAVPLGMVLGGGLGNVTDRLVRGFDGRVVDFIDLHVWPVFNVADMAIVIGVGLILVMGFRAERR